MNCIILCYKFSYSESVTKPANLLGYGAMEYQDRVGGAEQTKCRQQGLLSIDNLKTIIIQLPLLSFHPHLQTC